MYITEILTQKHSILYPLLVITGLNQLACVVIMDSTDWDGEQIVRHIFVLQQV